MGKHTNQSLFDGKPVMEFAHSTDRRNFLRWAGAVGVGSTLAVGGALAANGAASASDRPASGRPAAKPTATQQDENDLGILNYALTLEYLESDFYARGIAAGILSGRTLELVAPIADHEAAHVSAITDTITAMGGTPVAKPKIKYPAGTFTKRRFLTTASTFEELGVVAYHGQVPLIHSADVLGAAASIAGVESRHAAILARLTGQNSFPHPIEEHEPMSYVLRKVKPFLA